MKTDTHYQPLLSDVPSDDHIPKDNGDFEEAVAGSSPQRRPILLWTGLVLQSLVIIVVSSVALACSKSSCPINPVFPQVLYSPAQEVLEYQPKTFLMGIGSRKSIYQQQPSDAVDQAWLDLYNLHGLSQIPKSQARLLPNKTLPIPGDEEKYAVGLEVFHQLHCLDVIRQGLSPEYYRDPVTGEIAGIPPKDWPEHLGHCIENLRQSMMCASDISLVVWQWNDEDNRATIKMNTVHSCRNFDKIVEWAKAHRRRTPFDFHTHIIDDIEIPIF